MTFTGNFARMSKFMSKGPAKYYRTGFKILVSFFILFHWFCVLAWVMPKPSAIKDYLLAIKIPLPKHAKEGWKIAPRELVSTYLFNTLQWQDWSMFAPNPLQVNRYVDAEITFKDGSAKIFALPRLSRLNYWEAWIEKRYRKYQHRLVEETVPGYHEDFARYVAKKMFSDLQNPPVKVKVQSHESPLPRHDRREVGERKGKINYTRLLRHLAQYNTVVLVDYVVKPGDVGGDL